MERMRIAMDSIRSYFNRENSYEPLEGGSESPDGEQILSPKHQQFSWIDYSVFLLLGVAMLWAW
jgi:solute carrier family 29 (equilibrative nucleoside transporter), member 1/2/3